MFYAIWINAKFLRALNKTLKFDLKKDDHDSFGPSRRIAAQFFFKKALWAKQIRYLLMEWANYVAEKKWRNSVSHGNSSGRFLDGPPLKYLQIRHKPCNQLATKAKPFPRKSSNTAFAMIDRHARDFTTTTTLLTLSST